MRSASLCSVRGNQCEPTRFPTRHGPVTVRAKRVVASARRGDRSASDNLIPNVESTQSGKVGARPNPRCGVPSYPLVGIGYLALERSAMAVMAGLGAI